MAHDWQETLERITREVVSALGVTAEVTVLEKGDSLSVSIATQDSALLIGWRGGTLAALEYLIRALVFRAMGEASDGPEIHVDIAGYKERQQQELTSLALDRAQKVRVSRTPAVLRPMNAFERRIVHTALSDATDVMTESIGMGPNRRIIIKPRNEP